MKRQTNAEMLLACLEGFVREAVTAELAKQQSQPDEWLPHRQSPLGARRTLDLVREGKLVGRKVGKLVMVRRADLDAYIIASEAPRSRVRTANDVEAKTPGSSFLESVGLRLVGGSR